MKGDINVNRWKFFYPWQSTPMQSECYALRRSSAINGAIWLMLGLPFLVLIVYSLVMLFGIQIPFRSDLEQFGPQELAAVAFFSLCGLSICVDQVFFHNRCHLVASCMITHGAIPD